MWQFAWVTPDRLELLAEARHLDESTLKNLLGGRAELQFAVGLTPRRMVLGYASGPGTAGRGIEVLAHRRDKSGRRRPAILSIEPSLVMVLASRLSDLRDLRAPYSERFKFTAATGGRPALVDFGSANFLPLPATSPLPINPVGMPVNPGRWAD